MRCTLTLDDLEELCWINVDVIRVFLHVFLKFGRTDLYERYIRTPTTTEDTVHHTAAEYTLAGFPGAIGSADATHIQIERLPARFKNSHMGFKMSHTARTHNVTVNHRRQILSSTAGHPARWNDKTLATLDDFMQKMYRGATFDECVFNLYDYKKTNKNNNKKQL